MLYIFAGRYIEHLSLNFCPLLQNGVCCTANRIFVAGCYPSDIYIYTWKGVHIQTLSHQDLGLETSDTMKALQCSTNGTLLHLAVDKNTSSVNSLHAYRVSIRIHIISCMDSKESGESLMTQFYNYMLNTNSHVLITSIHITHPSKGGN